jgi:PiT family inorganic phosphate transporter
MALDPSIMIWIGWVSALIMCFAMGSNDESMGSAYGAKAFTLTVAIIVGATTEVIGSVLLGESVTITIQGKLFSTSVFADDINLLMLVFLCATASASIFLIVASFFGWPVSTTHGIIGAIAGAAVGAKGFGILAYKELGVIVASWFISPVAGGMITFIFYFLIEFTILRKPEPYRAALMMAPIFYAGGVCGALSFILFKGVPLPDDVPKYVSGLILVGVFLLVAVLSYFLIVKKVESWIEKQDNIYLNLIHGSGKYVGGLTPAGQLSPLYERVAVHAERKVETVFVMLQMMTAPMVAFARGANDVSNGIGPLAAMIALDEHGENALNLKSQSVDLWVLFVGGIAIAVGLFVLGRKVIKNIGENITNLTPTKGVCVEVGTAVTVMSFSALGVPISSTHTLVGCIFATGLCMKAKKYMQNKAYFNYTYEETGGLLELDAKPRKNSTSFKDEKLDNTVAGNELNFTNSLKIFASWVITIPAAAVLAGLSVFVVNKAFNE